MEIPYIDPCDPCEWLDYEIDLEDGECIYRKCNKPKDGKCWLEDWMEKGDKNDNRS